MKDEKLDSVHELYNYFIRRVEGIVRSKNKRVYGWEEIGRAGLSPTATMQSWHGIQPGIDAAGRGQDCVMSPSSHCYLDQSHRGVSVARSYSFEPMPPDLTADRAQHILGVEAPMWMDRWRNWAQYRPKTGTFAQVGFQVLPRLIALAEVGWSPKELRDWDDFKRRMRLHGARLQWMGMSYYRDPEIWPPEGEGR
jgi:hexosaminidase